MATYLIDVDGVVADFAAVVDDIAAELGLGRGFRPECYNLAKRYRLADYEEQRLRERVIAEPGFARRIPVIESAREWVMRCPGEVVFVTTPWPDSPTWSYDRERWLEEHFDREYEVVHTHAKHLVAGDVFVDDLASHVLEWADRHPAGWAYLVAQPYNSPLARPRKLRVGGLAAVPYLDGEGSSS